MLSKSLIKEKIKEELPFLQEYFGVKRVGLFGSFVKGLATANSDIDFIIEFNKPAGFRFFNLADYLEEKFQRPVDILTPAGVKSIRAKEVAERILKEVEYV